VGLNLSTWSIITVIGVFANDELVNQHDKLHSLGTQDPLELIVSLIVVALQIDQVFVGGDERHVAQLPF